MVHETLKRKICSESGPNFQKPAQHIYNSIRILKVILFICLFHAYGLVVKSWCIKKSIDESENICAAHVIEMHEMLRQDIMPFSLNASPS